MNSPPRRAFFCPTLPPQHIARTMRVMLPVGDRFHARCFQPPSPPWRLKGGFLFPDVARTTYRPCDLCHPAHGDGLNVMAHPLLLRPRPASMAGVVLLPKNLADVARATEYPPCMCHSIPVARACVPANQYRRGCSFFWLLVNASCHPPTAPVPMAGVFLSLPGCRRLRQS